MNERHALRSLEGWVEAGRSLDAAIEVASIEWGPGMPAGFEPGVKMAFERVKRQYGGRT